MRISDWSSDVCSSDLDDRAGPRTAGCHGRACGEPSPTGGPSPPRRRRAVRRNGACDKDAFGFSFPATVRVAAMHTCNASLSRRARLVYSPAMHLRSEEHTSELQSLMRISYAVFCLKKKKKQTKMQSASITDE